MPLVLGGFKKLQQLVAHSKELHALSIRVEAA